MKNNSIAIKNALYNGLGFLISTFFYLLITPIFISKLSIDLYGSYVVILSFVSLMSIVDLGFSQGIVRFIPYYIGKGEMKKTILFVYISLFLTVVVGFLTIILVYNFTSHIISFLDVNLSKIEDGMISIKIASLIILVSAISSIFSSILRAIEKFKIVNFLFILQLFLSNTLIIFYLSFHSGNKQISKIFFLILLTYILFAILSIYLSVRFLRKVLGDSSKQLFYIKSLREIKHSLEYKEILKFNLFYILNVLSGNVVMRLDKIIVAYFLGSSAVSIYSVVYNLASGISSLIGNITYAFMPRFSMLLGSNNEHNMKATFLKSFDYISLISFVSIMLYMLYIELFIDLWIFSEDLVFPRELILLIGYVFFFSCINSVSLWYFTAINKTYINLVSSVAGSLLFLMSSLFFIPSFGLNGVGFAYLCVCIPAVFYNYYAFKTLGFTLSYYFRIIIPYVAPVSTYLVFDLIVKEKLNYIENLLGLSIILAMLFYKRHLLKNLYVHFRS